LFWLLVAPLTQLAQAEAPEIEKETIELPQVPYFKEYALNQVVSFWSIEEWEAFNQIIQNESGWDNTAQNPNSTAFGYGQFLNDTWETVGCVKTTDPNTQIDCTIKYIKARYGTPQKALQFWNVNRWY
jgi:membrane-bound lytic murein transglycosylase MltF